MQKEKPKCGIIDMQLYFPRYYVDQKELEVHDKAGEGKYTIGLGQLKMAFVNDLEDINSICLTVLEKVLQRNKIHPSQVGRLEVGTETFLDKSKSIKTYLMEFFKDVNHDIEGIATSNACYGGTNALFNALNWMHSDYYDGRYAIVISADIAVYAKGRARPTGGCGAVAILLGPNAPIEFDLTRSTYMNHVYDFYKPDPKSEYPEVDGIFSIDCYFKALEGCYDTYLDKFKNYNNNKEISLNDFDYFCYHSPFSKNVEKAFYQTISYDMYRSNKIISQDKNKRNDYYNETTKPLVELFSKREKNFKLDLKLQTEIRNKFNKVFKERVEPGLQLGKNLGNIYCGSLYIGLLSLILNDKIDLTGKKIFMFSYGSGCAASIFSLNVKSEGYKKIRENNKDVLPNLHQNRIKVTPLDFEILLQRKEKLYLSNNFTPQGNPEELFPGTYYVEKVDEKWRRYYAVKGDGNNSKGRKVEFNKLSNNDNENDNKSRGLIRLSLLKNQLSTNNNDSNPQPQQRILPNKIVIEDSLWSGFHKKSVHERQMQIKKIHQDIDIEKLQTGGLNLLRADSMVENCIGLISMPVGLGLNFTINSKKYTIPMAVEEPSIIAGVSVTAKLISENNGFFCFSDPPIMISQIHIMDTNITETNEFIQVNKSKLISYGNNFCQNMVQRGGGVKDLYTRVLKQTNSGKGHMVMEILVNVCDSMGANIVNTIAENLSQYLEQNLQSGRIVLKILSNLAVHRKATAEFKIKIDNLKYKGLSGEEMANRILQAQEIAENDIFRATTHNKGIMNGIDAVALALGQDWRSIEAACHAYTSLNPKTHEMDKYKPMTYYKIIEVKGERYLYGNLTLPMAVGVVGGAINSNLNYQNLMKLLGNPNAQQLSHIMVAVGLAQNLAALRALVSEGIQKGHMGLQARNFAIAAGVPDYLIPDVVNFMKNNKSITVNTAKHYLESHHLYNELRMSNSVVHKEKEAKNLSSFFIEIDYSFLKEPLIMNFLLSTKIDPPIHFALRSRKINTDDNRVNEIYRILFGEQKNEDWLHEFIKFVNHFDFGVNQRDLSELYQVKYKLKMIVIVFFLVSYNLLKHDFKKTSMLLEKIINNNEQYTYDKLLSFIPNSSMALDFGLSVLLELSEILKFYLNNYVKNKIYKEKIILEVENSVRSFIKMNELGFKMERGELILDNQLLDQFLELRFNRLNARIMILCDLAFNEEMVSEDKLNLYMAIGRFCEIKITLLRDFERFNEGNHYLNLFGMFKNICEKEGINDSDEVRKRFFKLRSQEREILKQKIGNDSKFRTIIKYIENDLEGYFNEQKNVKNDMKAKL